MNPPPSFLRRSLFVSAAIFGSIASPALVLANNPTDIWNGSVDTSWQNANNWSLNSPPNLGVDGQIGSSFNVDLSGSGSAANLSIGTGSLLTVHDNSNLNFAGGSLVNAGGLAFSSVGDATYLYVGNNSLESLNLTGGGTLTLSNTAHNANTYLYGDGNVVLNNVDNTIAGEGQIGANHGMILQNGASGVVNANVSGQSLYINGSGVVNQGTMEATSGGVLQFNGNQTINNASGVIKTDTGNGSQAILNNNVTVQGGTLNGVQTGSGQFNPTLDGTTQGALTNAGTFTVVDNSRINTTGSIDNTGSFALTGVGDGTQIYVGNGAGTGTSFTGGGTIVLGNTAHNNNTSILGDGGALLENVNNTISGEGEIGAGHGMAVLNDAAGVIDANVSGQALILNGSTGVTNNNLLEATGGGILQVANTVNNGGGKIGTDTGHGSVVQLFNGSTIQGGTLNGNIQTVSGNFGPALDGKTEGAITNAGTLTVVDNSAIDTNALANNPGNVSVVNNTGSILMQGHGDGTYLYVGNGSITGTTLTGGGTVELSNTAHNGNTVIYGDNGTTLTNLDNTISGEGHVGDAHGMTLINAAQGVIDANVAGQALVLDSSSVTNQNLLEATNGGILQLNRTVLNGSGLITTDGAAGSLVQLFNGTNIEGGTLSGNVATANGNFGVTLDGLSQGPVTNAGTLTVVDNSQVILDGLANNPGNVSTINNTTAINLDGQGNGTYLYVGNGQNTGTTLIGGGTLTLSNTAHNGNTLIYGDSGAVLDNVNNTISGEGHVGDNHGMQLINESHGVIDANVSGQVLAIDAGSGITNKNLFEATNGGILEFNRAVDNGLGTITTDAGLGSEVLLLNGTDIMGGLLSGNAVTGSGHFNVYLDGKTSGMLTVGGVLTVTDNSQVITNALSNAPGNTSTINNTGAIALNGQGNDTYLYVGNGGNAGTTFTGGGTITLANTAHNNNTVIYGDNGTTLENVNNVISGDGQIGANHGMNILNDAGGKLVGNVTGQTLTVNGSGTLTNWGTLEASNGGTLHVTTVMNFANFSGATLTGGSYVVNGAAGATSVLQIDPLGNNAAGEIANIAAATTVTLNGPTANTLLVDQGGNSALKPLATNAGTFNLGGGYQFATDATDAAGGDFANSGTVHLGGTGTSLTVAGTGLYTQTAGTTVIDSGAALTASAVNATGGTLVVNGTLDPASIDVFSPATLEGTGLVVGDITNDGTVLLGGDANHPGMLTESGNYTQNSDGTLWDSIGSATNFGDFMVNGDVSLAGTLNLDILNSFIPTHDEFFTILESNNAINGTFANITGVNPSDWTAFYVSPTQIPLDDLNYGAGYPNSPFAVVLEYTGPGPVQGAPEPGVWADLAFLLAVALAAPLGRRFALVRKF